MLIDLLRLTFAFAVWQSSLQSYELIGYMLMTQNTVNTQRNFNVASYRMVYVITLAMIFRRYMLFSFLILLEYMYVW